MSCLHTTDSAFRADLKRSDLKAARDRRYKNKKQRRERLEQLIRVIKAVPKGLYNQGTFGDKTACGTVACAAGHAGLDPYFRRRGLRTEFKRTNGGTGWEYAEVRNLNAGLSDFSGLANFFHIPYSWAGRLFGCGVGRTRRSTVVKNIQRVLDGREPREYA